MTGCRLLFSITGIDDQGIKEEKSICISFWIHTKSYLTSNQWNLSIGMFQLLDHRRSVTCQHVGQIWRLFFWDQITSSMLFENNCLSLILTTTLSLFRKKRFEINFCFWWNASKFAIFIEKENPCSLFRFSFQVMPWSRHRQGHS